MILNLLIPSIISKSLLYFIYHYKFTTDILCDWTIWIKIVGLLTFSFSAFLIFYIYFRPTKRITRETLVSTGINLTFSFIGYYLCWIALMCNFAAEYKLQCHIKSIDTPPPELINILLIISCICYIFEGISLIWCVYKKYKSDKRDEMHVEIHHVNHLSNIIII